MGRIQYIDDVNGNLQEAHGSDGRLNVSSRSDGRSYYNSRDKSECYSLVFDDANATANDYIAYIKNIKTDGEHLVIHSIGINCEAASSAFKLSLVTGTATGGAVTTATNLNQGGVSRSATATILTTSDSGVTPMAGLTESKLFDFAGISSAYGHEEFRIGDQIRLGQDQAIAIELEYAAATDVRCFGVVFFYFE
jgi:hypothetical protein